MDQVEPCKRVAFVPYSQNPEALSRWGCLDFDAHDGDHERARRYAFAAFQFLLNSGLTVIFEHTGGGWHVWCIAHEFREARTWTLFLRGVAKAIEAPIQPGVCEIFPEDGKAKGVRAPGSWNPATDALNAIFWENTSPLIKGLRSPIGEVKKSSEGHFPDKESNSYGEVVPLYPAWDRSWKDSFRITRKSSRHQQLLGLVAEMFHQIGYGVACKIIEAHYREARVPMRASQQEHTAEFTAMWNGLQDTWLAGLNPTERKNFDQAKSENERDGFRIIRSFQRKADEDGTRDFPIARDNFALRLGITPKGGGCHRRLHSAKVMSFGTRITGRGHDRYSSRRQSGHVNLCISCRMNDRTPRAQHHLDWPQAAFRPWTIETLPPPVIAVPEPRVIAVASEDSQCKITESTTNRMIANRIKTTTAPHDVPTLSTAA